MTLAARNGHMVGIWFDGQKHQPDGAAWAMDASVPVLQAAREQLADYFAGTRHHFDLPLDLHRGTAFQQAVWHALLAIPCGATTSYGALAQSLGNPAAVRAVGSAVGRNPISIVVPCHRVVGSNGALTGYAGGLDRKVALLQRECPPFPTEHP